MQYDGTPATGANVAGSLPREATEEAAVLAEIDRLMAELQARRNIPRPAPESLVKAYHAAIERQYRRLDSLAAERAGQRAATGSAARRTA